MHISPHGLALIESFEGFSDHIYDDGTGVMTVGYGTTSSDVSPLPSHLSRAEAESLLARKLAEKYEPSVNSVGPVNQNQYDALVSFAYNLGPGSMAWDVGRYTRAHNYQAAANAMLQYDHAGGQRLLGLTRRREAERALYLTPAPQPAPDPLLLFLNTGFPLGDHPHVRYVNERETVKKFLALNTRPWANRNALRPLRHDLAFLRDRIYVVAKVQGRGWQGDRRGERYQVLRHLAPMNIKPATA